MVSNKAKWNQTIYTKKFRARFHLASGNNLETKVPHAQEKSDLTSKKVGSLFFCCLLSPKSALGRTPRSLWGEAPQPANLSSGKTDRRGDYGFSACCMGSSTAIVVPVSELSATQTKPPWRLAISHTRESPSPAPPYSRLRDLSTRKKGWKILR